MHSGACYFGKDAKMKWIDLVKVHTVKENKPPCSKTSAGYV